jgi:hypothetical protein
LWRAVREVLPALWLMAVTDNPTFRATESHNERSVGLVEGGERVLARIVPDNCHEPQRAMTRGALDLWRAVRESFVADGCHR